MNKILPIILLLPVLILKKLNVTYFSFPFTLMFFVLINFSAVNAQCIIPETPSPGTPAGPANSCVGSIVTYSVTSSTNATSFSWFYPSDWVVMSGGTTNSITFKVGQSGNIGVFGVNACGQKSYNSSQRYIQTEKLPTSATISGTATVCEGTSANVTFTNPQTDAVKVYYNVNGGTTNEIYVGGSSSSNLTVPNSAGTYTYNLLSVANNNQTSCSSPISGSATVTVNKRPAQPTKLYINENNVNVFCPNTTATFRVDPVASATAYNWSLPSGWTIISGQGTNNLTATTGTTSQSGNVVVTPSNGTCNGNSAGSFYVQISTGPALTASAASSTPNLCANSVLTNITHTTTGATGIGTATGLPAGVTAKWASNVITISGTPTTSGTFNYNIPLSGGCGTTVNATGTIIVKSQIVITPNKVDETCPTSNNGEISPILSGGLTKVRYIKLTQKYAAYQQVAEIEAFEIFTGTNVALASNGTTASGTSYYNNITYAASKAIDGNNSGNNNFWHGNTQTVNGSSITVDLKSGKDLDYLKIYNRTDCCRERGQNMLLELFDESNILIYSRTVDLYQSNTVTSVTVNVLDVSWTDGTTTLNRTGLDSGTYTLNYADAIGCASSSAINIGSVNTAPATPTATAQSFCGSATVGSLLGSTPSGSVVEWFANSSGGSALDASTVLTSTTYYAQSRNTTTGCISVTRTSVVVTINPLPSAPIVGTITQPTCAIPTGSVALSGLPSGNWTINPGSHQGTGSTTIISGLAVGTYIFTVINDKNCTSTASANVAIVDPIVTNIWTGTWSNGTPPAIDQRIIFETNYLSSSDLETCSCKITNDAQVVINSEHTLKVTNYVNVVAGSTLIFENNASLIQVEDAAVNVGDIIYKRHTNYVKRYDFTYWSSPVKNQKMKALSPGTLFDKYYRYDPDSGWKISYSGVDIMNKGEGYIIRAPQSFSITNATIDTNPTFVGEPHNGEITKTLVGGKVYLLGNPYPSAIDADEFLSLNSDALAGTLYFWTHNSPPRIGVPGGDATYSYTTSDYATFNGTGGVGTAAAITGGVAPTGKIAAGQGFFAPASATGGTVIYNNGMRISGGVSGVDNSQFFRLSGNSKTSKLTAKKEKNRLWLNLTNAEGAFKQTLIGYVSGATNDYESSFDGVSYDGNQFVDFYSINNEVNLSIQGRSLPFEEKDSVALGYKSTIIGDFKISIDHTDGVLSSQDIFLEDKDLKVLHNLKKSAYTFSTNKGIFNKRFVLRYLDKNKEDEVVVPETPAEVEAKEVIVSVQDRKITVNAADAELDKVIVYDMTGRKIFQKNDVNESVFVVPYLLSSHQVLAVDIVLLDGSKFSRKIVY